MALVMGLAGGGGCGDDSGPGQDGGGVDAELDGGGADGGDGSVSNSPCATELLTGQVFEIDPDGPDTQIHAAVAFDGEAVWVVYNRPDAAGGFDVYGTRLECDGTHRLLPFSINTTDFNENDPTLALRQDRVYVAWQTDTGAFPNNMQLLVRSFTRDGSAIMATDAMVRTTRGGTPVAGNTWLPSVAARPDGFAVAGARAVDDASGFQVFVQRLDHQGAPAAPTLDASFASTASQTYPTLAAAADGTLYLAYHHALPPDYEDQVLHTAFAPGATHPDPAPPVPALDSVHGGGAHLAVGPDGAVYLALAEAASGQVRITGGADFAAGAGFPFDTGSQGGFAPSVAPAPGGGAVAWLETTSGPYAELRAQRFGYDGSVFSLGTARTVTPQWVYSISGTAITHVHEDVYFLCWSEGESPDFRLMGTFLRLDAP